MDRGKMSSAGRGAKSKAPQHPQDIFALGSKSTVVVSRDSEKRNIHKASTSGVTERKRETTGFSSQPPTKRSRIGSPAESVTGNALEVDPVELVPNVLQALDTHNSDKLLGLLTGSIRLLKSQRSKPDPILCMSMLYLCKIRPNMFYHDTVTQSLCTLLKREQGAAFKSKGNPTVFILACNMLYAGHRDSNNWPDTFIKVYIEDALNERWWVDCAWCKCLVENIVTAFGTKHPPPHLIPSDNTLGTMSPSGSGSPLMGSNDEDTDNTELEYTVFPRYSSSYETVEALVLEAIKEQIQRRAAPDAIGKGFLKLLSATCGFPEIRIIAASRLEAWLHSGKLWRAAGVLLAHVCVNADAVGPLAVRDQEVLSQLARMRLKTKPLQAAYHACLREMVSDSPALLRSVVTHTIYNELSNVRSPNNLAVLCALIQAQPQLVPNAMAHTYLELLLRPEEYLRSLRALTRECVRAARGDAQALLPLARGLAAPPPTEPPTEVRERAFLALADLFSVCCLVTATHSKHLPEYRQQLCLLQHTAVGWLLETAMPVYRPPGQDFHHALNKIMFVEPAETYSKVDNWPPESERALTHRLCCEAPLPPNTLLRIIYIGLSKEIPVSPAEVFELVEQLVRRACALPPDDNPLQVDKVEIADYIFQLCQFNPPDNITLPAGYTAPPLAITSLYWRGWVVLTLLAAHNPHGFADRAADTYPTLRALVEYCITGKPSIEWSSNTSAELERAEAERAAVLALETHLAAASNAKLPVTEHTSRLLSQLTTLDPTGPARKPPQAILESLQQLSSQLRLGKLLCRQPALLLDLVERHGTRRAMPWLHQLLRHDQLELSVLPVQCLCEFLSAGGGEAGKAGELCAHVRRTVADSEDGARAVLQYYTQRLAHPHRATRLSANRGLKLVLSPSPEEAMEMDYNADVSPDEWLSALSALPHWAAVREDVVIRVRAALHHECTPAHLAAYLGFLAQYVAEMPQVAHTDVVLDLSQLIMERTTVMSWVLPPAEARAPPPAPRRPQHHALHHITSIFYHHLRKVMSSGVMEETEATASWGEERADLGGAALPLPLAHAHLKLLCYGPSMYDTDQEMYSWLSSVWTGPNGWANGAGGNLLPDWLRLQLVRSARTPLLTAALRALPAHKLALFIQTFGMPVASMTALLRALDSCPAGAVSRVGVERGYMAQLLAVQRARGARGGAAFAAALHLTAPADPPEELSFSRSPLPPEEDDPWCDSPPTPTPTPTDAITVVGHALAGGDDRGVAEYLALLTEEVSTTPTLGVYGRAILSALVSAAPQTLLLRPAVAAPLLRAFRGVRDEELLKWSEQTHRRISGAGGPVESALRALAQRRGKVEPTPAPAQLANTQDCMKIVAVLELATVSSLEALGNKLIETQDAVTLVAAITVLLQRHQQGRYEIKGEQGESTHVFGIGGLGCGLLLDWLAQLQPETLAADPAPQMKLMFVEPPAAAVWRPLLVTLLAHRASWATLHACLNQLLTTNGSWAAQWVLQFVECVWGSGRAGAVLGGATGHREDKGLRLTHHQLKVLMGYVVEEAIAAESQGAEAVRRVAERRLPLLLRGAAGPRALLAAALPAKDHPLLLLLLYMKVPRIQQLLSECGPRATGGVVPGDAALAAAVAPSPARMDRVAHTLLTALAAAPHSGKDQHQKVARLEAGVRAAWARGAGGAGARALALCGALLRGEPPRAQRHHHHLLAAIELLPDNHLFAEHVSDEVHKIVEWFVTMVEQGSGGGGAGGGALAHRVAALLRRYAAAAPGRAQALLRQHRDTLAVIPALSALYGGEGAPASLAAPPHALRALQRRTLPAHDLLWHVQEIDAWGSRRGGAWGGASSAGALLAAVAPLAAAPHPPLRAAALTLLAKLLPAVTDTTPGFQAILECLDSNLPEVTQSVLDKLPDLIVGIQEHATRILMKVFELGITARYPVDTCLTKCVATINLHRGC